MTNLSPVSSDNDHSSRVHWGSRIGFVLAVAGSAIGLGNIWRFPYILGENGGGAFLIVYLFCLLFIGIPVFISEILIGRTTQTSPSGAFAQLGKSRKWGWAGKLTIITGFIVSSFYSAVAGWMLGYLVEALQGKTSSMHSGAESLAHYNTLIENPLWGISFHFAFLAICSLILFLGVRSGIEKGNKIMMPGLIIILVILLAKGLTLPHAFEGILYVMRPDWSVLTPATIMIALGQSFFTLSLGQGTMVTYGSYLNKKENMLKGCIPVILMDTLVSLLAAAIVFSIAFSAEVKPDAGPGLVFHTLPLIFSQISGGYFVAVLFFLLLLLAAISSQISAMEPTIAYLQDEKKWSRNMSCFVCFIGVFLLGIPSAISYSVLKGVTFFGSPFLDFVSFLCSSILIPLGGFFAVILVGWKWGTKLSIPRLQEGASETFQRFPWLKNYFWFCFKYTAPILILIVFLNALGFLG